MMTVDDSIIAPSRGTQDEAKEYARVGMALRRDDVNEYIDAVYALCDPDDFPDASIVIAQSVHETSDPGPWQSRWWVERLNPAGMGITGDPRQNAASPTFETGIEAAYAHVSHMLVYAIGPAEAGSLWHRRVGGSIREDDPRYDAYVEAYGNTAQAETIKGLSGTWATDVRYAEKIVARSVAVYPDLPNQSGDTPVPDITFGKVPHPAFTDRIIPSSQNTAWNDLGPRDVKAVVWHRMLGSLWGTDGYFRGDGGSRALTDYGVGVEAQDGAKNDGLILKWNEPLGTRSPWANGVVSAPYGDGLAFVNRYGINGVNRYATAIEISGFQETALSEKSRDAIAGITAYWADQYEIPWDVFPVVKSEGRSFVCWHQEFTIGTGKQCPFAVVMNETNALIERTRGILKKYQTASEEPPPPPPVYADPIVPDWLTEDLERGYPIDHVQDGLTYFAALRPYEAIRAANRLQGPDTKAPKVGPRLSVREKFRGMYTVRTDEGRTFVVTQYATHIDAKALTPSISIKKR